MNTKVDKSQFGPWALITGASSGIGREFARQLAQSGINLVLAARRGKLLDDIGRSLAKEFGIQYRVVTADFSQDHFIDTLTRATDDLDIGLVISNAGAPSPGLFLEMDRDQLASAMRLNANSHLDVAHHYCKQLAARRRGGLILVGAMGAGKGVPYMANDTSAKAYVHGLGRALHEELKATGVHVTVLAPGIVDTAALTILGLTPEILPMKPMKVDRCVAETLRALKANRELIIPGRMNRLMNALVPVRVTRNMMSKLFKKALDHQTTAVRATTAG